MNPEQCPPDQAGVCQELVRDYGLLQNAASVVTRHGIPDTLDAMFGHDETEGMSPDVSGLVVDVSPGGKLARAQLRLTASQMPMAMRCGGCVLNVFEANLRSPADPEPPAPPTGIA